MKYLAILLGLFAVSSNSFDLRVELDQKSTQERSFGVKDVIQIFERVKQFENGQLKCYTNGAQCLFDIQCCSHHCYQPSGQPMPTCHDH